MEWNTDIHITPVPHVHPSVVHPSFWTGWQNPNEKGVQFDSIQFQKYKMPKR